MPGRPVTLKAMPPPNRMVELAFGSATAILLVAGVLAYRSSAASDESDRWVRRSHHVLEGLQDLVVAMASVEADAREFVSTGDDAYVDSYRAGLLRVTRDETAIGDLTADDPGQRRRFLDVQTRAGEKIQRMDAVLNLGKAWGLRVVAEAVQDKQGPATDE